jgi:hypothetical protein
VATTKILLGSMAYDTVAQKMNASVLQGTEMLLLL